MDIDKEWDFVIFETHRKRERHKLAKRELLFILQSLLIQIARLEKDSQKQILAEIYNRVKGYYRCF